MQAGRQDGLQKGSTKSVTLSIRRYSTFQSVFDTCTHSRSVSVMHSRDFEVNRRVRELLTHVAEIYNN